MVRSKRYASFDNLSGSVSRFAGTGLGFGERRLGKTKVRVNKEGTCLKKKINSPRKVPKLLIRLTRDFRRLIPTKVLRIN